MIYPPGFTAADVSWGMRSPTRPIQRIDGSALGIGDRWIDATRFREWIYDGSRWVSPVIAIAIPGASYTVASYPVFVPPAADLDLIATGIEMAIFPATNHTAILNWKAGFSVTNANGTITSLGTCFSTGAIASQWNLFRQPLNVPYLTANPRNIFAAIEPTGASGSATIGVRLNYREIAR